MAAIVDSERAARLKDEGNVLFRKGKFHDAVEKYSSGRTSAFASGR